MPYHEAVALRAVPWKDQHLIVTLFVRNTGRVEAMVFGSRSFKSKLKRIYFMPLNQLTVSFAPVRRTGGLPMLSECQFRCLPKLGVDPVSNMYRQFVAELLINLIQEQSNEVHVWELLEQYAKWLCSEQRRGLYPGTVWFLIQLCEHLGVGNIKSEEILVTQMPTSALESSSGKSLIQKLDQMKYLVLGEADTVSIDTPHRLAVLKGISGHLLTSFGLTRPLKTLEYFEEQKLKMAGATKPPTSEG